MKVKNLLPIIGIGLCSVAFADNNPSNLINAVDFSTPIDVHLLNASSDFRMFVEYETCTKAGCVNSNIQIDSKKYGNPLATITLNEPTTFRVLKVEEKDFKGNIMAQSKFDYNSYTTARCEPEAGQLLLVLNDFNTPKVACVKGSM